MWLIGSLMLAGMFILAGAMFDWGFVVENRATRGVIERFGRPGGRLLCLVVGVTLITAGAAILSVGPLPA